jgi:hypothetical protein
MEKEEVRAPRPSPVGERPEKPGHPCGVDEVVVNLQGEVNLMRALL